MRADQHALSGSEIRDQEFFSSSRQPAAELRPLVEEVLRSAVAARGGSAHAAVIGDRDPMRELCAAARAGDVRAETLILALKDGWRRLPDAHAANRLDGEVTLAVVITRCIREYYGPRRS
jgi:hypothetical protein